MFCPGIYFDVPEITPSAVGIFRFNSNSDMVNGKFYSAFSTMVCRHLVIVPQTKLLNHNWS